MSYETSELCDQHGDVLQVVAPGFRNYGGVARFHGSVRTVKVDKDFALIRDILGEPGDAQVLVVDGGGYLGAALMGDKMAAKATANGWAGVVINGCIRDAAELATIELGVRALNSNPSRSGMQGTGERDVEVSFGGVRFAAGAYLYADEDGIVIAEQKLT